MDPLSSVVLAAVVVYALFRVVRWAIREALADHHRTVRVYGETGEWRLGSSHPAASPDVLTDQARRSRDGRDQDAASAQRG